MPAYANQAGNIVSLFQAGRRFKRSYATLGSSDKARLADGVTCPVAFALKTLTSADEARIELVKKAM